MKDFRQFILRGSLVDLVEATTRECPECLSQIPLAARRCAFCTAEVGAA